MGIDLRSEWCTVLLYLLSERVGKRCRYRSAIFHTYLESNSYRTSFFVCIDPNIFIDRYFSEHISKIYIRSQITILGTIVCCTILSEPIGQRNRFGRQNHLPSAGDHRCRHAFPQLIEGLIYIYIYFFFPRVICRGNVGRIIAKTILVRRELHNLGHVDLQLSGASIYPALLVVVVREYVWVRMLSPWRRWLLPLQVLCEAHKPAVF